jgi:hypothetical protein
VRGVGVARRRAAAESGSRKSRSERARGFCSRGRPPCLPWEGRAATGGRPIGANLPGAEWVGSLPPLGGGGLGKGGGEQGGGCAVHSGPLLPTAVQNTPGAEKRSLRAAAWRIPAERKRFAGEQSATAAGQNRFAADNNRFAADNNRTAPVNHLSAADQKSTAAVNDLSAADDKSTAPVGYFTAPDQNLTAPFDDVTAADQKRSRADNGRGGKKPCPQIPRFARDDRSWPPP